jgi:hypothetical protein
MVNLIKPRLAAPPQDLRMCLNWYVVSLVDATTYGKVSP